MKQTRRRIIVLILLLAYFGQGMIHACHASITFDEAPHLAIGYATLRTGDFRLQPIHIHPPLANVLAATPLHLQDDLPDPRLVPGWEIASLSAITNAVVWQYPHPARIATAGRVPILLLSVLLGALIFRWAKRRAGTNAGLFALTLFAFDPNFIAHGSLITTDIAAVFFIVATLSTVDAWMHRTQHENAPSIQRLMTIGVLLGLAQLVKVSALMLVPVVGLLTLIATLRCSAPALTSEPRPRLLAPRPWLTILRTWVWIFVPAAFVIWAGYGFQLLRVPGFPFPIPAGTHLLIFKSLQDHYNLGHPTFLIGRTSTQGWWWYFPAAFVLKTTLPILIVSLVSLLRTLRKAARKTILNLTYLLFPGLYILSSLLSTVNIGYRHLLPILPFLYIAISTTVIKLVKSRGSRFRIRIRATLALLLGWHILGTVRMAPDYLTFFNELVGGPANGYRYLVDSNLDWGQNLWDLRDWMRENNRDHIAYAHFTPAVPQTYGISADFLPPDPRAVDFTPWNPAPGLYAIGSTVYQGPYAPDVNTYAWFRSHTPLARLGNALWIYEVPERAPPSWALICWDTAISAETLYGNLGQTDVRVLYGDCTQAYVVAAGNAPGLYVMSPETAPPPNARLEVSMRNADGTPWYNVYRSISGAKPPYPAEDIIVTGPLAFLGHSINGSGTSLTLETYWRVDGFPDRPLSLMAHLIGPDGSTVAVGDGLGFPVEQWQPGDIIVQKHVLPIPENAMAGPYVVHTGAYWLDTMERWSILIGDGANDYIALPPISISPDEPMVTLAPSTAK